MMGTRQKLIYGDEVDQVFNPHSYCYLKRQSSKIKKRMRRRARRSARREATLTLLNNVL